jgi:hypothetical protein
MTTLTGVPEPKRHSPSFFGPLFLIGIGLYFLLSSLDYISGDLHWFAVLRLWPLMLVFVGLNIIAQQAPRPFDYLLSGLVSLIALLFFGYVLLFGLEGTSLNRLGTIGIGDLQTRAINLSAANVETAVVEIQTGPPGAKLYALEDSPNLIEGTATYHDRLIFDSRVRSGEANVRLALDEEEGWFFMPDRWGNEADRWQIGLRAGIPLALTLGTSAGFAEFDLHGLTLNDLSLDVNAGEVTLFLPGGDYGGRYQVNAGSVELNMPHSGRHTFELDVNAGSVTIHLPDSIEARVEVRQAMGAFDSEVAGLRRLVDNGSNGGVWQTAGYDGSRNRIDLVIDISMGSVTVESLN